ncbi:uncharacterized protein LOC130970020 [Arachis stenosperma]|uniref:uncharacterized protein LOC130970020 n=1 Tax=Arachis stenosperma TaxID=217475 RepID=UPI0025AC8B3D|nr:uncharacterized protein LOC130970020 [Arachis stenosperma]XP_057751941.1 uncharacterized protein LOC130970020 [Arachis stenosperma]XP_057751942.1 uncharacterized protein LOC130970020 [Arachis stenosperma]XP_057751943.1 uncharacterized protein LOC130970020 [Arachis stenosperma]XP_057751944.1 uncharacterized protein LOC130970020 [Arachis stenosperma]
MGLNGSLSIYTEDFQRGTCLQFAGAHSLPKYKFFLVWLAKVLKQHWCKHFHLEAHINVSGKKRTSTSRNKNTEIQINVSEKKRTSTSCNKITGIQFSKKNHQRIMITSEDFGVQILEGMEHVQAFKCRTLNTNARIVIFYDTKDSSKVVVCNIHVLYNPNRGKKLSLAR